MSDSLFFDATGRKNGFCRGNSADNKVAHTLIAARHRDPSDRTDPFAIRQARRLREPVTSVGEQGLLAGHVGQNPVEWLVSRRHTAHEGQYGFFIGHGSPHPCHPAEVAVQTFYQIGGVNH